jgi:general secretion pathway protein G
MISNMISKKMKNEKGMTLVEIMAVLVLIGLIMAVVAKGIFGTAGKAKLQMNVIKMEKLKNAVEQYKFEYNSTPEKLTDLISPSGDLKNSGVVFTSKADPADIKDVWGKDFIYRTENNGRSYSLTSLGSDGMPGGEGENQDVTIKP